jgi:large subunit ribosomal protein L24
MVHRDKINVRKGDNVIVIAGKERGKTGKVLSVNPEKQRVVVEKINLTKKHSRPTSQAPQGGIIEKEAPLHVSNVKIVCSKCNVPVRIKKKFLDDGKKVRTCIKCGELLDQ